jgi:hypothetical protein
LIRSSNAFKTSRPSNPSGNKQRNKFILFLLDLLPHSIGEPNDRRGVDSIRCADKKEEVDKIVKEITTKVNFNPHRSKISLDFIEPSCFSLKPVINRFLNNLV